MSEIIYICIMKTAVTVVGVVALAALLGALASNVSKPKSDAR